jgi:16S rRNA (guanine527-N7)-methyltransferase
MDALAQATSALLGVSLTSDQRRRVQRYAEELLRWNQRANLTAITDPAEIASKHFLDSFSSWLALAAASPRRVIDVGTGAGFPGLALKILVPALEVTLVEATGKKAEFCRHVVRSLEMHQVDVIHGRAEDVAREAAHREKYDGAVARAVAELPTLAEYLLPFTRLGGLAVAQKGESGPSEAHAAASAMRLLGGVLRKMIPVELPGVAETRYLVVMEKVASTPERYPRRAGIPAKRPLT